MFQLLDIVLAFLMALVLGETNSCEHATNSYHHSQELQQHPSRPNSNSMLLNVSSNQQQGRPSLAHGGSNIPIPPMPPMAPSQHQGMIAVQT